MIEGYFKNDDVWEASPSSLPQPQSFTCAMVKVVIKKKGDPKQLDPKQAKKSGKKTAKSPQAKPGGQAGAFSRKPKNARAKRALKERESKTVEGDRGLLCMRGTHTSEQITEVLKDLVRPPSTSDRVLLRSPPPPPSQSPLPTNNQSPTSIPDPPFEQYHVQVGLLVATAPCSAVLTSVLSQHDLKKPASTYFSRRNDKRPFEDETSVEFLCQKNEGASRIIPPHVHLCDKKNHFPTFVRRPHQDAFFLSASFSYQRRTLAYVPWCGAFFMCSLAHVLIADHSHPISSLLLWLCITQQKEAQQSRPGTHIQLQDLRHARARPDKHQDHGKVQAVKGGSAAKQADNAVSR